MRRLLCAAGGALMVVLVGNVGCRSLDRADSVEGRPEPVKLRICLASAEPQEGYEPTKDEVGRRLYVAPEPLATEADVQAAAALRGSQRGLVLVEFGPLAAAALESVSAAPFGQRVAIYIDERLVLSPVLARPIRDGKVILDGGFSQREAERIARGLSVRQPAPVGQAH